MIAATNSPINRPIAAFFLSKATSKPMLNPTISANPGDIIALF
jgi:hypothetical protein